MIQNRTFKLEEPEKVLGGSTPLNIVYDEAGTVYCYDHVSDPPVRHPMAYIGHEPEPRDAEVSLPGAARGLGLPQRRAVQRRARATA